MATMAKEVDTGAVLIERAQSLVPTLAARAEETAALRRMPDETFHELRDLDLLKAARAERFGGYALGLDEVLEIVVRLGRGLRFQRLGVRHLLRSRDYRRHVRARGSGRGLGRQPGGSDLVRAGAIRNGGTPFRRLSPRRALAVLERLRPRGLGVRPEHCPALGRRRADPGLFPVAPQRLGNRGHLVRDGPCRHGQQGHRDRGCVRPAAPDAADRPVEFRRRSGRERA